MNRKPLLASLLALPLAMACLTNVSRAAESDQPTTVAAMLKTVGAPATTSDSDVHAFQQKFNAAFAGKPITLDAGLIIQIVTEGGGVKLISFPTVRTEAAGDIMVGRSLAHATLLREDEANGKKLAPGDSAVVTGTCVSASVKVTVEDGKPVYAVHVTMEDSKIVKSSVGARMKRKSSTAPDAM